MDEKVTTTEFEKSIEKLKIGFKDNIEEIRTRSKSTISEHLHDLSNINDTAMILFKQGLFYKREGNLAFRIKNYDKAIEQYTKAIEVFKIKCKNSNIDDVKFECSTNMAICYFAKKEYLICLKLLNKVRFFII
jgi:tetratricopeptide (TPR) repeat protein